MVHTISALNTTENIYGQVWIDGHTPSPGPTDGLWAQIGYGPEEKPDWIWMDAGFNVDAGNNDEFVGHASCPKRLPVPRRCSKA
jgi:hypothetical protein